MRRGRRANAAEHLREEEVLPSVDDALAAAAGFDPQLGAYRCDRCRLVHLTSRTKGKRVPRPAS